jgi:hypothetical protein
MNVIGEFQNIIDKCLNYYFLIGNMLICKNYVIKFIVFLTSLTCLTFNFNIHQFKRKKKIP